MYGHCSSCDATGTDARAIRSRMDAGKAKKLAEENIISPVLDEDKIYSRDRDAKVILESAILRHTLMNMGHIMGKRKHNRSMQKPEGGLRCREASLQLGRPRKSAL